MASLAGAKGGAPPKGGGGKANKPVYVNKQPTAKPVQVQASQPTAKPVQVPRTVPAAAGVSQSPSMLPNNTIATLSPKQIKSQAVKSITAAYAPAISSIQQQETQASGLAAKRSADDQLYSNWMATQTAALTESAKQQDGALTNLENSIQGGINQNAPAQLQAGQQAANGTVSNMSQSNLVGSNPSNGGQPLVGALQNASNTQQLGALQGSTGLQGINDALVNSYGGNNQAIVASNEGNIQTDLNTTMNALDTTLATTRQNEAKDTLSLVNTLNSNNLNIAEHNQSYGLQRAGLANTINQEGVTQANANRAFNQTQQQDNRTYNLTKGQDQFGNKLADYNAATSRYAATHMTPYEQFESNLATKTLGLKTQAQGAAEQHQATTDRISLLKTLAYNKHLANSDSIAKTKAQQGWATISNESAHWQASDQNTKTSNAIRALYDQWQHQTQLGKTAQAVKTYNLALRKVQDAEKKQAATGGASPLTKGEVNTKVQSINSATALVNDMVANGGLTSAQARQLFTTGGQYQVKSQVYSTKLGKNVPTLKTVTVAAHAPSDPVAWSGFSMSNAGTGLTAWDVNELNKVGVTPQDLQNANFHTATTKPAAPAATFPPVVNPNLFPSNG